MNEFDVINRYFKPLCADSLISFDLTDDAAMIPPSDKALIVTNDAMTADVHFFASDPAEHIAFKLISANVSDLAAMGALPYGYTLAITAPNDTSEAWYQRFCTGLKHACQHYGGTLLGGDTCMHSGPLTLSLTAIGYLQHTAPLRRSKAKIGDHIFVSGPIGDKHIGLKLLQKDKDLTSKLAPKQQQQLIQSYHRPIARVDLVPKLKNLIECATDISDGLGADLHNICEQSSVSACVNIDHIPLSQPSQYALKHNLISINTLIAGGDDYELLCTAPSNQTEHLRTLGLTHIGSITQTTTPMIQWLNSSGQAIDIQTLGYEHGCHTIT